MSRKNLNTIFKALFFVCFILFAVNIILGILSLVIVVVTWIISMCLLNYYKEKALGKSRKKYSQIYTKPEDCLVKKGDGSGGYTVSLLIIASRITRELPAKTYPYTKWIDVLVTKDALIYVYLIDDTICGEDSLDWNTTKKQMQTLVSVAKGAEEFLAVAKTGRRWICRYLLMSSERIVDVELTNEDICCFITK